MVISITTSFIGPIKTEGLSARKHLIAIWEVSRKMQKSVWLVFSLYLLSLSTKKRFSCLVTNIPLWFNRITPVWILTMFSFDNPSLMSFHFYKNGNIGMRFFLVNVLVLYKEKKWKMPIKKNNRKTKIYGSFSCHEDHSNQKLGSQVKSRKTKSCIAIMDISKSISATLHISRFTPSYRKRKLIEDPTYHQGPAQHIQQEQYMIFYMMILKTYFKRLRLVVINRYIGHTWARLHLEVPTMR